jgi:hypothetical protein
LKDALCVLLLTLVRTHVFIRLRPNLLCKHPVLARKM